MSRTIYYDADDLWWQIIAVVGAMTVCFAIIWAILHPAQIPRGGTNWDSKAKEVYVDQCKSKNGVPNVGSSNSGYWSCQK